MMKVTLNSFGLPALALAGLLVLTGCGNDGNASNQTPAPPTATVYELDDTLRNADIDGTNQAILMVFYTHNNEVVAQQMPVVQQLAGEYAGRVKFTKVNCLSESKAYSNAAFVTLYDVHQVPTFVLRRKGDTYYHKHAGPLSERELKSFIDDGLRTDPTPKAEVEKR